MQVLSVEAALAATCTGRMPRYLLCRAPESCCLQVYIICKFTLMPRARLKVCPCLLSMMLIQCGNARRPVLSEKPFRRASLQKAAVRACQEAIRFKSLPSIEKLVRCIAHAGSVRCHGEGNANAPQRTQEHAQQAQDLQWRHMAGSPISPSRC